MTKYKDQMKKHGGTLPDRDYVEPGSAAGFAGPDEDYVEPWDRKKPSSKIKSDGGSTDYYRLPEHATELRHLISHKGMSKSRGDIFKACYRLGEKDGDTVLYDLKKIKFFAEDLIEMFERGEHI